jgi:outer membrane protein assembly factor BamB
MKNFALSTLLTLAVCGLLVPGMAMAAPDDDVAMYGGTPARNMVSDETGLPATWDLETGENVLWRQTLGTQSYGGPVVAGGKVFVGTNNEARRNPKLDKDRGNVMAFDAMTGEFFWQSAHEKLTAGRVHDWPLQGVCSAPYVEGDRLYYVSNRAEFIAADTEGFRDGENDGPIKDEANSSEIDEDVIWRLDMIEELTVFPHNLAVGSALAVDDLLMLVTGNGVDEGHINVTSVRAPSFIAVDKNTGKVAWESDLPGESILHGSWSNPAYGVIGGKPQVVFPGGDGWLYSLDPKDGSLIWKFDANPKDSTWELGGSGTRNNIISTPVIYKDRVYIGVGQDPEHGEAPAHFWVFDATGTGDITGTSVIWKRHGEDFNRTMSTAAIADGIVYISDLSGFLYALDAETGEHFWTYDAFAAIWGSAFVADGKVYLGDEDGDVVVLKAGKGKDGKPEELAEINMGTAVYTTPVAKNGVLYIASRNKLFALKVGAKETTPPGEDAGS